MDELAQNKFHGDPNLRVVVSPGKRTIGRRQGRRIASTLSRVIQDAIDDGCNRLAIFTMPAGAGQSRPVQEITREQTSWW
jgi:hypothetical protein